MTDSTLSTANPESVESFFTASITKAQAAADACVALHRYDEAFVDPVPTPAEIREMDDSCDRWFTKRTRCQERVA